jgi:IMP dehydrogenase
MLVKTRGYDFDDLLLVPKPSDVWSRSDVDLSVELGDDLKLKVPIIAAPMKGIATPELIIELSRLGGIGILHRFQGSLDGWERDLELLAANAENFGVAVGLGELYWAKKAIGMGAKIICIDVANGYLSRVNAQIGEIIDYLNGREYRWWHESPLIMAGNVATGDGTFRLANSGAHLIRVGIGSGQTCTTRNVTGVGVPQLTAIEQASLAASFFPNVKVVSDGGIRNSGDAVKAFAAGADAIMLGTLLGKTFESGHDGTVYGMASRRLQVESRMDVKSVEGIELAVEKTVSLEDFVTEFCYGIRSGCTYVGVDKLVDLPLKAEFTEVGRGSIKAL